MLSEHFVSQLYKSGFNFFTGVPCSYLASILDELSKNKNCKYIPSTREDAAVGLATGAYLAGRWPCILMQNSGIGYCLNALTSLNLIYKIPSLLIVSFRGFEGKDAPEHIVMGKSCLKLLDDVGISYLVPEKDRLPESIKEADSYMRTNKTPFAVFIKKEIAE